MSYYSLHLHTDMSNTRLLDCINKVDSLIDYTHKIGLLGIAITDHEILGNHVKAQKHLEKRKKENPNDTTWQNFKLLLGNEIYLCRNDLTEQSFIKGEDAFYHFILIALDAEGHQQLRELSTIAFKQSWYRNMRRVPTYYRDIESIISANPGHVWASTACLGGFLPQTILKGQLEESYKFMQWCQNIFKNNFSLEMQPSEQKEQILVNTQIIQYAEELKIPYIITTDAHYLSKDKREIHKAFLNSKKGDREVDQFYASTYLMTAEEIHSYMDKNLTTEQVDTGLSNTCLVANLVKDYSLAKDITLPYMPLHLLPRPNAPLLNQIPYLYKFYNSTEIADQQLSYRILQFISQNSDADINRIEIELKSVYDSSIKMNMCWSRYLLQVSDYINIYWTEGDSIVGPGRGSAVAFYINYILNTTQIDPTKEKVILKPWRFLNPERASILDIDIDIQGNRRNKCIQALKNTYGQFNVIEVATFGTEKAKSAIRTAARGLGIDVNEATYLSSFIQSDRGAQRTLTQTFYGDEENDMLPNKQFVNLMTTKYPKLWEVAQEIEGLVSKVG